MMRIRSGNMSLKELFLEIRGMLIHGREYSDTPMLVDLKSTLSIIQRAAGEKGDRRALELAIDMQSAIDDYLQRGDKDAYIPSESKIEGSFS